ncbi:MAG TPA: DedA family protein [Candidatus Dormibacteraeota bacterium]|nr:DedA family protein [Candidatus Dormibacteraeota bacterium]
MHAGPRARWLAVAGAAAVVLLLLGMALVQEGTTDLVRDAGIAIARALPRLGAPVVFALLYVEESGVPLPLPGDVAIVYLGHVLAGSPARLVGAWAGLIAVVVAGASNLYLIARRWGRPLLATWGGPLFDLDAERLNRIEGWFDRWGPLAIIIGRHIFGFRVPITVAAGLFKVPYLFFVLSVAISSAPWAAAWLWVGVRFGARIGRFLHVHWWGYLAFPAALAVLIALGALRRRWRASDRADP